MKLLKSFSVFLLITVFSVFSVNTSYAEELEDVLCEIFWTCEDSWNDSMMSIQTPLEKARAKLKTYTKWEEFIKKIDNFVNAKKSDKAYLQKISAKVKAFDLSAYNSPVANKNATLAAVIKYIDALLDDTIAKLSY